MNCRTGKVRNPKTGRCVKKLSKRRKSPKKSLKKSFKKSFKKLSNSQRALLNEPWYLPQIERSRKLKERARKLKIRKIVDPDDMEKVNQLDLLNKQFQSIAYANQKYGLDDSESRIDLADNVVSGPRSNNQTFGLFPDYEDNEEAKKAQAALRKKALEIYTFLETNLN